MGWLFYTDGRVKSYADEKAEITRLCTFEGETRKADAANAAFLDERLGHTDGYNSGSLKQRVYDEFEARLTATLAVYEREGRARAEIASLI